MVFKSRLYLATLISRFSTNKQKKARQIIQIYIVKQKFFIGCKVSSEHVHTNQGFLQPPYQSGKLLYYKQNLKNTNTHYL